MLFLWIKVLHIASFVCWFAVLFYLPRLFVYHVMTEDKPGIERFKVMERKLLRGIGNPAMIATLVFGIWLVALNSDAYLTQNWFWAKMVLVTLLVGYHHICVRHFKRLRDDQNQKTHTYFRVFNEIPVFLLLGIVILVIVRPF